MGYVNVTEDNGACAETTENYEVQIDECTGLDELTMEDVKLYPNPANSMITIELVNANIDGYEMNVWNMHGKKIETIILASGMNQTELNVADYPAGIYFVELSTETTTYNKIRFIVNH
jgi:hypothetical protein